MCLHVFLTSRKKNGKIEVYIILNIQAGDF